MQRHSFMGRFWLLPRPCILEAFHSTESKTAYKCSNCHLNFGSEVALFIHRFSNNTNNDRNAAIQELTQVKSSSEYEPQATPQALGMAITQLPLPTPNDLGSMHCHLCNKDFISPKGLQQHIGKVHNQEGKNAKCPICNKEFKHKHAVKFHMIQVHDKSTRISCIYCQKILYNKYLLDIHIGKCLMRENSPFFRPQNNI